jgi:hypothetical protein
VAPADHARSGIKAGIKCDYGARFPALRLGHGLKQEQSFGSIIIASKSRPLNASVGYQQAAV